jgi:hypothetical protein
MQCAISGKHVFALYIRRSDVSDVALLSAAWVLSPLNKSLKIYVTGLWDWFVGIVCLATD